MIPMPHLARVGLAFTAFGAGTRIFAIVRDYWNHESTTGFEFTAVIAFILCIFALAHISVRRPE